MKPRHALLIGLLALASCTERSTEMPSQSQEFFSGYGGETTEELIAMAGDYRIDSIVLAFEEALEQQRGERSLTTEESWILAIVDLEREVNNGGYLQFFENSSREHAASVVQALEAISCPQVAELTQRAIATLKIQGEISEAAIEEAIETREDEISESLDALDSEFIQQTESIEDRLFEFIKANRDHIKTKA
jgi:hypothetical protein